MPKNVQVQRATFNQVREAQHDLIFNHIENLIKHNEVMSEKSREIFFNAVEIGLLGLERKYPFVLSYNGGVYNLGSVAKWIRKFAYLDDNDEKKQKISLKGKDKLISNKELWLALRDSLYNPMADALTLSLTTSAEMVYRDGGVFEFRPDKPIIPKQRGKK